MRDLPERGDERVGNAIDAALGLIALEILEVFLERLDLGVGRGLALLGHGELSRELGDCRLEARTLGPAICTDVIALGLRLLGALRIGTDRVAGRRPWRI